MDTAQLTRLVQNRDLATVNSFLGPVANFFWIVYANYAIDGVPATEAVDRTLKLIQTYLANDAINVLYRSIGQTKAA